MNKSSNHESDPEKNYTEKGAQVGVELFPKTFGRTRSNVAKMAEKNDTFCQRYRLVAIVRLKQSRQLKSVC